MTNTTARAHTEECRKRLEGCLAEDEETKLRSEAAKRRVDNWLASRVESTEKPRSGDAVSHESSGAASSGVDGETLDECVNGEESYVDDVNGGFLDPEMVREARVEELTGYLKMQVYCRVPVAEIGSHRVIKTRWVDKQRGRAVSRNSLPAGGERGEETQQRRGGERELLRIHSTS